MTAWAAIPAAAVVMTLGAAMSYHKAARAAAWYPGALVALCAVNGLLWAWASRRSRSDADLFALGLAWDAVTIAAYTVLPLAAFGVRLSPAAWCGLALMLAGVALVKWAS